MEFTCEQIGLTQDELQERVVIGLVERILGARADAPVWDDRCGVRQTVLSEARERVQMVIEAEVAKICEAEITPKVEDLIEGFILQKTNQWGEKTGEPVTFTEFIVQRAEAWITEKVSHDGKSKAEAGAYSWSASTTRIAYMIDKHLQYHIETAMSSALADANSQIAEGILQAVKVKLDTLVLSLNPKVEKKRR
jgi:hypothetical protein